MNEAEDRGHEKKSLTRIAMPSWRSFRNVPYMCTIYEAQDVLRDIDVVDLLCPHPAMAFAFRQKWLRRLVWKDFTRTTSTINPGLTPMRIAKNYDLFIAVCQNWGDLLLLNAIQDWQENSRTSLCWIDEMWAAWIPRYKNWLHLLNRFDHVIVNLKGSVKAVERVLGRRCHWVPFGIDALRFCPYPAPPPRVIDVYSIGRKWGGIHQALLELSKQTGLFYVHDTVNVSEATMPDYREHRDMIAATSKRSRFFLVAPAKMNSPKETQGQSDIGSRYFEGAASGAVLIGNKPDDESFQDLFGWKDSVVEIRPDGSDVVRILEELRHQPEKLDEIGRRNCAETLVRHDWAYRWRQILEIADLKPLPAMELREKRLRQLADMALKGQGAAS
jgi:hypothetical protein